LVVWFIGWLIGCLVGQLVSQLVDWVHVAWCRDHSWYSFEDSTWKFWFHKMCCQERLNSLELVNRLFCLSLSTS